jgi:hypothetical protein
MSYGMVQTDKGEVRLLTFVQEHFSRSISAGEPYSVAPGEYAVTIPLGLFIMTAHMPPEAKAVFFTRSRIAYKAVRDAVAPWEKECEESMRRLVDGCRSREEGRKHQVL